jgi:hypothetical protein
MPLEHRDFKLKLRYSCAVTVCIAAACKEREAFRIVLCSDTMLAYEDLGSTNRTCKVDVLGHGWCVQLAGDWSSALGLNSILKERIQALPTLKIADLLRESQAAVRQFMKSPLYDSSKEVQLLLSGFEDSIPRILEVSIFKGKRRVDLKDSFGAIGWGGNVALTLLSLREHQSDMPLAYVAYLVYEAKRGSEKTGLVGPVTIITVQYPNISDIKDRAYVKIMGEAGLAQLEAYYRGLWKIPLITFPKLTDDMFINTKKPQPPQQVKHE